MFVLRFKKKRFIVALIVVLAVITVFIILINADFTHVEDYAEFNSENYSLKADSSDDRIKFFQQLGINAVDESVDEVIIPQDFNSVYEKYNEIQKKSVFDLSNYAGSPQNAIHTVLMTEKRLLYSFIKTELSAVT